MGTCASIQTSDTTKGPIRSRFSLDNAPDTIPKTASKAKFPLIGYKCVRDRNLRLSCLTQPDFKMLLTELYEYLPQYPTYLVDLQYFVRHPNKTVLYTLKHNYYAIPKWKREVFGNIWTETGDFTAKYTFDPLLYTYLNNVIIENIRIYDSYPIVPNSVYLELEDTKGNIHTILPKTTGNVYKVYLNINETMFLDEMEKKIQGIRMNYYHRREPNEEVIDLFSEVRDTVEVSDTVEVRDAEVEVSDAEVSDAEVEVSDAVEVRDAEVEVRDAEKEEVRDAEVEKEEVIENTRVSVSTLIRNFE